MPCTTQKKPPRKEHFLTPEQSSPPAKLPSYSPLPNQASVGLWHPAAASPACKSN